MSGSKLLDGITFVCSICQYFISGSKRLDRITLYVQLGFEPDMKNRQVEYTGRFHPN
jgi:hypothetical protein